MPSPGENQLIYSMPSDEEFQTAYRRKRYLENLRSDALLLRGRDLFLNFMTIDRNGKFAPVSLDSGLHWYFRRRFSEFLAECQARYGPYPNGLEELVQDLRIPRPDSPIVTQAVLDTQQRGLVSGTYIVKYGRDEHLRTALAKGQLRIAPASSYQDKAHNSAIQDDELSFTFSLHDPSPDDLRPYARFTKVPVTEPFRGSVEITETTPEDYYVFCLSSAYEPRLFADFEANACLLIREPERFRDRLMQTVMKVLGGRGWSFSPVTYVDPMTETGAGTPIHFRKNFRYSYQKEWRAAWLPIRNEGPLLVHFVDIGPLDDIAELIVFNGQ
jgi:hypothetical protein